VSTGASRSTRHGAASAIPARCRGTSTPPRCSRPPPNATPACATSSRARRVVRATSSTSGTGCCPRPTSPPCARWWSGCMAGERVAVLLMAYGGPGSLDDVEPYLNDVRGGRPTSPELLGEIRERYARIGGRSPILELTRAQSVAVGRALGAGFQVYVGMRHWHPFIRETADEIVRAGHRHVVGVVMAPHYSAMSVGAYEKKLLEAAQGRFETALVRSWGDHPSFLEGVTERTKQALQRFPSPAAVQVIFTAHSLPQRILAAGDPYPDELRATAEAVAQRLHLEDWRFAYQSAGA